MESHFTSGAQRALIEAAAWSTGIDPPELEAPALLMGLLAESECQAAILLAGHGIDSEAVRRRWPALKRRESPGTCANTRIVDFDRPEELRKVLPRFSDELLLALAHVRRRFCQYPRPLMLATEHLLMGLAAIGTEVSVWLHGHGVEASALEADIHRRSGYRSDLAPAQSPEAEPLIDVVSSAEQEAAIGQQAARGRIDHMTSESEQDAASQATRGDMPQPSHLDQSSHTETSVVRILDAAANRAMEGLRVVEDYVRFVLDDRHLTEQLKLLRHDLAAALASVPIAERLAARETQADAGTSLTSAAEQSRPGLAEVLVANFARLHEALRSLEEYGKIYQDELAARVKQIRYRSYTLQRAVEITRSSLERLDYARLYVLVDGGSSEEAFAATVGKLVEAGVPMLQLRDKRLQDRPLLARARLMRKLTAGTRTVFVMNDRPDLAALAAADGVHVGQEELTVKDVRAVVGPKAIIGVSTHSIDQARQAVLDGANYIGVGPTFPSGTKRFEEFPGLELVRAVAEEIRLPAFAIGGINQDNLHKVLEAGARRVAVSGAIANAPDPAAAAKQLMLRLAEASAGVKAAGIGPH